MTQNEIELLTDDKLEYNYCEYIRAFNRQKTLQSCGLESPNIFRGIKLTLALLQEEMLRRDLIYD